MEATKALEFLRTHVPSRTIAGVMSKRVIAVSLKMTPEDAALLKKAAARLWPEAPITRSSYVLALAKLGAQAVLKK